MKHKTHHFAKQEKVEETIAEYMSSPVQSVTRDSTIREVSQMMTERNIGSVLVKNGGEYIGIVTERDLTRKVLGKGLDAETTAVTEVMSSPLITLEGTQPVTDANQFMAKNKIRHLAITIEGRIEGIISVKDLVAFYANPRLRH
ncbi:MAG: CBS domain-containing protein [Nitrospinae bacterium]|nr:CBS domain-containing protein [Nitrospinota bacterium]MZH13825.1 CBS domain-containing protein [Nitrospinota bacterium]